jgi:hypothetical protein
LPVLLLLGQSALLSLLISKCLEKLFLGYFYSGFPLSRDLLFERQVDYRNEFWPRYIPLRLTLDILIELAGIFCV